MSSIASWLSSAFLAGQTGGRRWLIWIVCCCVLGVAASSLYGVHTLRSAASDYRYSPMGDADILEVGTDFHRFVARAGRFVANDPAVDFDRLALTFELLRARARTVAEGRGYKSYFADTRYGDLASDLEAFFAEVEPLLSQLDRGDLDGYLAIAAKTDAIETRIDGVTSEITFASASKNSELRATLLSFLDRFVIACAVFSICVLALLALSLFESWRAARSRSEADQSSAEARFLAEFDSMTGLANRVRFAAELERRCAHLPETPFALMLIDLDEFRALNDAFGHQIGDDVLAAFSERLKRICRKQDFLARLDGDEFALIAQVGEAEAKTLADGLARSLDKPLDVGDSQLDVSASLGVVAAPSFGSDPETLLARADVAINRAKRGGKRCASVFTAQLGAAVKRERMLREELKSAIEEGAFTLVFQPCVSIRTGEVEKVEALLRWTSPQLGPISPAEFIPLAEECGLITDIGEWVVREACAIAAGWRGPAAKVGLAVNVSPIQFARRDVAAEVSAALSASGLAPERLELEITEGMVVDTNTNLRAALERLREVGVRVAIDDFGTGYSNLGYLRRFPIDRLKIDRSFVIGLGEDPDTTAIAHGIVRLARSLDLSTTAEGVETSLQAKTLLGWGCETAQGFGYARPLPEDEFLRWLGSPSAGRLNEETTAA